MRKTDEQLVQQALQGDLTAYPELMDRYMNVLFAIGYHRTGDFHLAQDITQEALIRGYSRLSSLQENHKFGSWLYAIARRISLDMLRKNRCVTPGLNKLIQLEEPRTVEEAAEENERREAVWVALGRLQPTYREAAILHYISGITVPEMSRLLNVSVSAIESRVRRAKQQLKRDLQGVIEETLQAKQLGAAFRMRVTSLLLRQLNCYYIPVVDPYLSAQWYRDHFGLRSMQDVLPGANGASLSIGSGMELYLLKPEAGNVGFAKPFELLAFDVDELELLVHRLRDEGVNVGQVEREEHRLRCRFQDRDGHLFVLTQKNMDPADRNSPIAPSC